jgi:hypothetical protein
VKANTRDGRMWYAFKHTKIIIEDDNDDEEEEEVKVEEGALLKN